MATDTVQNETIAANWQAAWEAYASAKRESDEYERTVFRPAWEKIEALQFGVVRASAIGRREPPPLSITERERREAEAVPDWDAINEKMEDLNAKTYSEAEWAVLLTPAPDRDALEWKMDKLFGEGGEYSPTWRMDGINAFLADVRRLLNH